MVCQENVISIWNLPPKVLTQKASAPQIIWCTQNLDCMPGLNVSPTTENILTFRKYAVMKMSPGERGSEEVNAD